MLTNYSRKRAALVMKILGQSRGERVRLLIQQLLITALIQTEPHRLTPGRFQYQILEFSV